ncbi:MAG: hypothetical protein ABL996_07855 [Micropepsaceae bacterium]
MRTISVMFERMPTLPGWAGRSLNCFFGPKEATECRRGDATITQAHFVSLSGYSAEYRRNRRKCQEQNVIENSAGQTPCNAQPRESCQRLLPEKSLSWEFLWTVPRTDAALGPPLYQCPAANFAPAPRWHLESPLAAAFDIGQQDYRLRELSPRVTNNGLRFFGVRKSAHTVLNRRGKSNGQVADSDMPTEQHQVDRVLRIVALQLSNANFIYVHAA